MFAENQNEINTEVISGDIQGVEPKFSSVEDLAIDVPESKISDANEGISSPEVNEGEHGTAVEASKNDYSDDLGTVTSKEATSLGVAAGEKSEVNEDNSYPLASESKCSVAPCASEKDSETQQISDNLEVVEVRVVAASEKSENHCAEDSAVQVQENQISDKINDFSNSEISDPVPYTAAEASGSKQIAENAETESVRQTTSVDSGFVPTAGNCENQCRVEFADEVQDSQISDGNNNVSNIEISEPSIAAAADSEIELEMKQISEDVATEAVREGAPVEVHVVTAEEKSENSCQEDVVLNVQQVEQDIEGNEHVESSMYTVAEASEVKTEMNYTSEKMTTETAMETTSVDFAVIAAENSENQCEEILVEVPAGNNKNKDISNPEITGPEPCRAAQASEVESKMKQIPEIVETERILDDAAVEDVTLAAAENSQISENVGTETVRQSTSVDFAVAKEAGDLENPCGGGFSAEVPGNQVSDENKDASNTGINEPEPSTAFGASETHSEMKQIFEIVETETVREDTCVEVGTLAAEENSEMISHNMEKEIAGEVSLDNDGTLTATEISENPSQKDFMVDGQDNKKSDERGHEPTTVASCNEVEIKQIPHNSEMVTAKVVTLLEAGVAEVSTEKEKNSEDSAVEVPEKFYDASEDVSNLESNEDQYSPVAGTSVTKDDVIQMAVETSETVTLKETVSDISLATDLKGDISSENPVDGSHGIHSIPCVNNDPIVESDVGEFTAANEGLPSSVEGDDKDLSH